MTTIKLNQTEAQRLVDTHYEYTAEAPRRAAVERLLEHDFCFGDPRGSNWNEGLKAEVNDMLYPSPVRTLARRDITERMVDLYRREALKRGKGKGRLLSIRVTNEDMDDVKNIRQCLGEGSTMSDAIRFAIRTTSETLAEGQSR